MSRKIYDYCPLCGKALCLDVDHKCSDAFLHELDKRHSDEPEIDDPEDLDNRQADFERSLKDQTDA